MYSYKKQNLKGFFFNFSGPLLKKVPARIVINWLTSVFVNRMVRSERKVCERALSDIRLGHTEKKNLKSV